MTKDEILALKPGRELDALVAEKVMGMKVYGQFRETDRGVRIHVSRYSTDISAAWAIVEKAFKEWFDFGIGHCDKPDMWQVYWGFDGYGWRDVEAPSAPEAICKAALLAVLG